VGAPALLAFFAPPAAAEEEDTVDARDARDHALAILAALGAPAVAFEGVEDDSGDRRAPRGLYDGAPAAPAPAAPLLLGDGDGQLQRVPPPAAARAGARPLAAKGAPLAQRRGQQRQPARARGHQPPLRLAAVAREGGQRPHRRRAQHEEGIAVAPHRDARSLAQHLQQQREAPHAAGPRLRAGVVLHHRAQHAARCGAHAQRKTPQLQRRAALAPPRRAQRGRRAANGIHQGTHAPHHEQVLRIVDALHKVLQVSERL
jgi:hypothetical protein